MRIAVMAAGAMGGYFGGRMAAAGHDVAFIARGTIAMLSARKASRSRARSATFTSRMSTSLTIRHRSDRSTWCYLL